MNKCPSCGTENPDDSKFCTGCGGSLAPAPGSPCPGCGAEIPSDSKFCVSCGRPVAPQAAAPQPPPSPFCTNCGARLEPGTKFCTGCGAAASGNAGPSGGPSQTPGSMDPALAAYWTILNGRFAAGGFEALVQAPGLDVDRAFKRQRMDLIKGGKVTTLCAVKWVPGPLAADSVRLYSLTVFNFASSQKALLGRNALQPLVVYPVLISPACPPDVQAFLSSHWPKRVQAYEYPVVVALSSKEIFCHRSTPVWGLAFHGGIKNEAETLFQP